MRSDYVICKIRLWKMGRKLSPRVSQHTRYNIRPMSGMQVDWPTLASVTPALPPPAMCLTADVDDPWIRSAQRHLMTPGRATTSSTNSYSFAWSPPQRASVRDLEKRVSRQLRQLPQEVLVEVRRGKPPLNFHSSMEAVTIGVQQSDREQQLASRPRRWST